MALLPPFFLDAVLAIGEKRGTSNVDWVATGFLFARVLERLPEGRTLSRYYLVTNRHVVEGMENPVLRLNPDADQPGEQFDITSENTPGNQVWYFPDTDADVAVSPIKTDLLNEKGIVVKVFRSDDQALTRQGMKQVGVSEGDGIFVLGFPLGLAGKSRNAVLVRGGVVASLQEVGVGDEGTYLVDSTIFPGNSGGPCVLRPESISIEGTPSVPSAYLIGVVSRYLPFEDRAVSDQTGLTRVIFEENSGLVVVEPVDAIEQAIDKHMATLDPHEAAEELARLRAKSNTSPQADSVPPQDVQLVEGEAGEEEAR